MNNPGTGQCQICGKSSQLSDGWQYEVDRSEARLMLSSILTPDEQEIYFPDYPIPVMVCHDCSTFPWEPPIPANEDPLPARDTKVDLLSQFADRWMMSELGTLIIKDLLDAAGYETYPGGFEQTHPALKNMNLADPNASLVRLLSNPDLVVVDREISSVYRVEVKTTVQIFSDFKLSTSVVNKLRTHHSDSILMVYHIPTGTIWCEKLRNIDWQQLRLTSNSGKSFYQLPLGQSRVVGTPIEFIFERITPELIKNRQTIICELFRRYFVGLELSAEKRYGTYDKWVGRVPSDTSIDDL